MIASFISPVNATNEEPTSGRRCGLPTRAPRPHSSREGGCASVLPKLALAIERTDPAALLDQVPDLSERLKRYRRRHQRALFDAFDLRVVYDKAGDRLSISAR
jgi:hypothetical protein